MGNYINKALLGTSPYKKQQEEAKGLVNKWDKTGLLDGLNEDFQRSGMAVMLENQAKQLINEVSKTNPSGASGDEEWSGVALPLVRRIFGEIAAQEFVSVQPMNLPSGLVFYLDFKYGTAAASHNATGTNMPADGATVTSLGGKTGPNSPEGSSSPYGVGGFYGAGRYGYSAKEVQTAALTVGADVVAGTSESGVTGTTLGTGSVLATDYNHDVEWSASYSGKFDGTADGNRGEVHLLYIPTSSMTNPDLNAIRSFGISGSNGGTKVFPEFTRISSAGNLVMVVQSAGDGVAQEYKVTYYKQPTDSTRGDFEDTEGVATNDFLAIPQVDLQLNSAAIVAKTRKLKAVWTPELAQDLNAYHSVDAEAELTSMLSEYISMEIDLEILDMLMKDAVTTDYWSAKPGYDYNSSTSAFENVANFTGTRFEWWQTLVAKIQKVSNTIHQLTLRGGANFCVVGPKIATILESLPGYSSVSENAASTFAMGVSKIGAVDGRFTVYKNPYMTENTILVGFRGSNFLETGAVYAPYVPLIMTPLVYDPSDFTPRKGVMTRYAKKMIRPEFYAKIHCSDLNLI